MRQLVSLITSAVQGPQAVGARPSLSTDGLDITALRNAAGFTSPMSAIFLIGSQAQQLTSPAGGTEGVELWGFNSATALGQWFLIGILHDGAPINIAGAAQGFSQVLQDIGDFTRIAVAATINAGTTTFKFGSMETWTS